jgi:hypothetical protein
VLATGGQSPKPHWSFSQLHPMTLQLDRRSTSQPSCKVGHWPAEQSPFRHPQPKALQFDRSSAEQPSIASIADADWIVSTGTTGGVTGMSLEQAIDVANVDSARNARLTECLVMVAPQRLARGHTIRMLAAARVNRRRGHEKRGSDARSTQAVLSSTE